MLIVLAAELTCAVGVVLLVVHYLYQRRIIDRYAQAVLPEQEDTLGAALIVCSGVRRDVRKLSDDPTFVQVPFLEALGATPVDVLRQGGCCSGTSRLAIVALCSRGISAAQATLYHASGRAQHCLVEAICDGKASLIDPTYGLYFVDESGSPIGIAALRAGVEPRLRSLTETGPGAYPANNYYAFDFRNTRTANWTCAASRRHVYRIISAIAPGWLDTLRQPVLLEWPQLILGLALAILLIVIDYFGDVLSMGGRESWSFPARFLMCSLVTLTSLYLPVSAVRALRRSPSQSHHGRNRTKMWTSGARQRDLQPTPED